MDSSATHQDGRRIRRDKNRQSVIDSYIDLMSSGVVEPSRAELTAHSGLSERSIYRYFSDNGALISAVADHIIARFGLILSQDYHKGDTLSERILSFVAGRLRVYDLTAPITRIARTVRANDENVVRAFRMMRDTARSHLGEQFSLEFEQLDQDAREELITLLHIPFLFDSIEYAHTVHGDRDVVSRVLQQHMHRHLQK
jgi:AcrR family transcriptional regulator